MRALAACAALGMVALTRTAIADEASPRRAVPDYDGRGNVEASSSPALWAPRIALAPVYVVTEYGLRAPLGAAISAFERAGVPGKLYDFFTFGPDHKAGVVPIGFVDFGFRPSVGVYAFWDDAFARGQDLRLHATTWGPRWVSASIAHRLHWSSGPREVLSIEASGISRPDYAFFGVGPRSRQSDLARYGATSLQAQTSLDKHVTSALMLHAQLGVRSFDVHHGELGDDPSLDERVARAEIPAPPGFSRRYTIGTSSVGCVLDSRDPGSTTKTGARLALDVSFSGDPADATSFVKYGGTLGGFLDLNGRERVVSLTFSARFADPVSGTIPFPELVHLGGYEPMRAFYPGRLLDRSAVVAELGYRWPIWVWLDGATRFEVGNVFGEHLNDFKPALLRFSGSIGVESRGSSDNALQILIGLGSETFDSGGKVDSVRLVVGTTHGF